MKMLLKSSPLKTKIRILIFFLIPSISSCGFVEEERTVVARVGEHELYEKDLKELFKSEMSREDSIYFRQNFVNNWVKEHLIFQKALENLSDTLKNKDRELKEYYRSLIRFEYEKELIRQRLDPTVTEKEIEDYYEKNKENFLLKKPIVRLVFLHLAKDPPKINEVEIWLRELTPQNLDSLFNYSIRNAHRIHLDENKWFFAENIFREFPINTDNIENLLRNKRFFNLEDTTGSVYLVNVLEYRKGDNYAPLEFEKENIKKIILNKRKVELVNKMENKLYREAVDKNEFEIYD